MTEKTITLETTGEFPFTFYIEKAVATETEKELVIEGVASTTNIDHDNERMSKEALDAMVNIINTKGVPLRVEHSKSENAIIGDVFKGWVDERQQLHIQARLDKSHPVSPVLHHSMKELGKKMGFSVGGLVKRAMREFSEAKGKLVKTFYDVELKEVSVTPRPANYDSWAIAKSMAKNEVEAEAMRDVFHDQFLFENPQMDYLQVFAKSVSGNEVSWNRVEGSISKNNNKDMSTETDEKKEKTTKEDEDTTKAVSRAEFKVVVKSIETMAKAMEAMVMKFGKDGLYVAPHDANSPSKDKPEDESPAAKSETDGTDLDGKREKSNDMGSRALDQREPNKDKPEDESPAAKTSDKEETKEKAKDTDETYEMATTKSAIASLEAITARLTKTTEDDTKEKAADSEDDTKEKAADTDETKEKGMAPIDVFVGTVTKTIEAMATMLEKKGMNLIGFEKSQVERIVNDPAMQEEIRKMLKIPGSKKSVVMGTPYMVTKSGKRFALTATEVGAPTIEKSRADANGKTPSFKDVYKADFSSVREAQE